MKFGRNLSNAIAVLLAATLACPPASALVTLNESHDHIYVNSTFGMSHDSNIFANRDSQGDIIYSAGFVAQYTRRAGWIGLNASAAVNASQYGKVKNQNFSNPSYSVELTKQTGRTTGSLSLSGARESRADAAVNLRSTSWNYNAALKFAYPVISRLKITGGFTYSARKYLEQSTLSNLSTYEASTDLSYILPGGRDLIGGYRYRYSETSRHSATTDHSLSAGLNGRIMRGLNGTVRAGYQFRVPEGPGVTDPTFRGFTASASTSYALTRKFHVATQISKDFTTTATDSSVDATAVTVDGSYAYNSRWTASIGGSWGDSRFLGEAGRVILVPSSSPLLGPNRHDNYANWNANLAFTRSERLKINFGYSWFENWSTTAFADFIRTNWNLNLSSRW